MFSSFFQSIGLQEEEEEVEVEGKKGHHEEEARQQQQRQQPNNDEIIGIAPTDTDTTDRRDDHDESSEEEVIKIFTVTAQPGVEKLGIHIIKHGIVQKVNPTSIFSREIKELDQILDVNGINLTSKNSQQILETIQSFNTTNRPKTFTVLRKPKRFKISSSSRHRHRRRQNENHNKQVVSASSVRQQQQQQQEGDDSPSIPSDAAQPPSYITIRTNSDSIPATKIKNKSPPDDRQYQQQSIINSRKIMEENTKKRVAKMNSKATRINMLGEIEYLDNDENDNDFEDHTLQTLDTYNNKNNANAAEQYLKMGDICFDDHDDTIVDIEAAAAAAQSSSLKNKRKKKKNRNPDNNTSSSELIDRKQYHCVVSGLCLATIGLILSLIAIVVVFFVVGVFNSTDNDNDNHQDGGQSSAQTLQDGSSNILRQNDFGD